MTDAIARDTAESLLSYAERTLATVVYGAPPPPQPRLAILDEEYGAFSTLKIGDRLRGCIGNFAGAGALRDILPRVVRDSALNDPRFPPVRPEELEAIAHTLSILFPGYAVETAEEIRLGVDGIILAVGGRRAVFLPEVAEEQGWDLATTLSRLAHKAGLRAEAWRDDGAEIRVFQTVRIRRSAADGSIVLEGGR